MNVGDLYQLLENFPEDYEIVISYDGGCCESDFEKKNVYKSKNEDKVIIEV